AHCEPTSPGDPEPEATVPEAPAAPAASMDGGAVTVSWQAPADGGSPLTGYTVQLLGGSIPLVQDVAADAASAVFADVAPGTYRASVIAVNTIGASAASPESEPVTVAEPTDP